MNCDKDSFPVPYDVDRILQKASDYIQQKMGLWRLFDKSSIADTVMDINSIPLDGGGIFTHASMKWAIYPPKAALAEHPDFVENIFTNSTPITPSPDNYTTRLRIIMDCAKKMVSPQMGGEGNTERNKNIPATFTPLSDVDLSGPIRIGKIMNKNNWYKKAQNNRVDMEDVLSSPDKINMLTKEQLADLKSQISVTESNIDSYYESGLAAFQRWITLMNAQRERMNGILLKYAAGSPNENLCANVVSQRASTFDALSGSINGIAEIYRMTMNTVFSTQGLESASQNITSQVLEERRRNIDNACDAMQQFEKAYTLAGNMRNLINSASSDRFSKEFQDLSNLFKTISGTGAPGAGRIENITGFVAG